MELLLFRPEEFQQHYNCVDFNVESIPLDKRRTYIHSSMHIVLCVVYYLLYIPCLWSIWRNRMHSCYKMLLYLGCVDCTALWIIGFMRGYLGLTGAVYCSSPIFQYVIGGLAMSCLFAQGVAQFILSINRCMALLTPKLETTLFAGYRTWLWMLLPTGYGAAWFIFGKTFVFSGVRFSWVMNPYVSWNIILSTYHISPWYNMHILYANICLPSVYGVFFVAFLAKTGAYHLSSASTQLVNAKQRMVFIQVFLITVFNVSAGLLQFIFPSSSTSNEPFYLFIHYVVVYSWLQIHGFPPVIFLTLNQTIRADAIALFRMLFAKPNNSVGTLAINKRRTAPNTGAVVVNSFQQTFGGNRSTTSRMVPTTTVGTVTNSSMPTIFSGTRRRSMRFRV